MNPETVRAVLPLAVFLIFAAVVLGYQFFCDDDLRKGGRE